MSQEMSEKLDRLIESNVEIQKNYALIQQSHKTLISLIRNFIIGCSFVIILILTNIITTRSDMATIKATLATTDNIVTLREEIRAGDEKNRNEIGRYISLVSYIAIEAERARIVSELFVTFSNQFLSRDVHIKDEELERFRNIAIAKLNNAANLGTARGE